MDILFRGGGRAITSSLTYTGGVDMTMDKHVKAISDIILEELTNYYDMDFIRVKQSTAVDMVSISIEDPLDDANEDITIVVYKDWGRTGGIGVEVFKPITKPFVEELHEFNSVAVNKIAKLIDEIDKELSRMKVENWVTISYGVNLSMSIITDTTEAWYDDVGNSWRRGRLYLGLKFTKMNMGMVEVGEIVRMVSSSMFWDIIMNLMPTTIVEKLIEIDNIADETYPNF